MTDHYPKAVLFDMDGTIVDTEPYWMDAEAQIVSEWGGTWTAQDGLNQVGNDLMVTGRYIREVAGVMLEPAEIVERLLVRVTELMQDTVPWRPGAVELLADIQAHGIPMALVTMSYKSFTVPMVEALPEGTFSTIVTGDAVSNGKPHPEAYLKAAADLGVAPFEAVAIEDSNTGARSAESAGCTVLCVPNHVPILEGERRIFAETLPTRLVDLKTLVGA